MDQSNPEQLIISINKDVPVETRFKFLTENYYFHQLIGKSEQNNHFLVEEIMNDTEKPIFYYLKQMKCLSKKDHHDSISYYTKFLGYCGLQTAKKHIVKLIRMHEYEERDESYFELVLLFQFGESDRIDIEIMEPEQVLRFIKNVCVLLNDVSTHAQIYHCNLSLKNIVICNEEPSISGFKPIFINAENQSWKLKFIQKFGIQRLEVFCVGLLWLNFLNVDLNPILLDNQSLEDIERDLVREVNSLPSIRKIELLSKLLKPSEFPELSSHSVILEFDEYFILERISKRIENHSNVESELKNSFDAKLDQQIDFNSKSIGFMNSELSSNQNSQKSELNLFTKNLRELVDQESYSDLDKKGLNHSHHQAGSVDFKTNPEFTLNEGFSVVKKDGINGGESRLSEVGHSQKGGESKNFLIGESGVTLRDRGSEKRFMSLKEMQKKQKDDVFKTSSASVNHEVNNQDQTINEDNIDNNNESNIKIGNKHKESLLVDQSISLVEGDDNDKIDIVKLMTTDGQERTSKKSLADQLRISDKLGIVTSISKKSDSELKRTSNATNGHQNNTPVKSDNKSKITLNQKTSDELESNGNKIKKSSKSTLQEKLINNPTNKASESQTNTKTSTNKIKTDSNSISKNSISKITDPKSVKKEVNIKSNVNKKSSGTSSIKLESDKLFKKNNKKELLDSKEIHLENKRISDGHDALSKDEGYNPSNEFYVSNQSLNSNVKMNSEELIKNPLDFLSAANLEDFKGNNTLNSKNLSVDKKSDNMSRSVDRNSDNMSRSFDNRSRSSKSNDGLLDQPQPRSPLKTTPRESVEIQLKKSLEIQKRDSNEHKKIKPLQKNHLNPLLGKHPITLSLENNNRTQTNLFPEIVETMLQKRKSQNLLKVKSDHLFKQMKQKEELEKKMKQEQQDLLVQDLVEKNLKMKIKKEFEKTESQKKVIEMKEIERFQKETELFDKIKKIASDKHKEKKKEQFEKYKDKRAFLGKTSNDYEPFDEFKKNKTHKHDVDAYHEDTNEFDHNNKHRTDNQGFDKQGRQDRNEYDDNNQSKMNDKINNRSQDKRLKLERLKSANKLKRNVSENILNRKKLKEFELSPIDEIDKRFYFNHHHQVFQIPFRKVVQNFKDEDIKKSDSVDKLSKTKQKSVLEKFEETLERYKKTSDFLPRQLDPLKESFNRQSDEINNILHISANRGDFNSVDALNQFLEKGFLSKQMKSIVSENTQQFWSAGPKNYLNENDKNPLEFSNVRHIDFTNDALLNPVKEWKDLTIFKNDRIYQPNLSQDNFDLKGFADFCQNNLSVDKIDKIVEKIQTKSTEVDQKGLIELNKIIASVFYCLDMSDKAKEELLNAVENIKELKDPETVELFLGEIIFNLAFLEFTIGDIHDSIEMLKNQYVINRYKHVLGNIIGNSLISLNKLKEARELFQSEVKKITLQQPTIENVLELYQYVCKILECFRREKNKIGPAEFFKDLENRLFKFSTLFKQMDKSAPHSYEGIGFLILMKFLHFGQSNSNYGMMNYVVERSLKQGFMEPIVNLTNSNKENLSKYLMSVCDYLKSKNNFGNFENNFSQYLDLSDELIQSSPVTVESLKLHCSILFNKGVYQLQKLNKSAAREHFRKCFVVIHQLFQFEYKPAFNFVDKLAKAFMNKKDYDNAMFFYEELSKFSQIDSDTKDIVLLKMAKIHFIKEQYSKASQLLGVYLEKVMLDPASPSSEHKLLKWICLFKISCLLSDDKLFEKIKFGFEQQTIFSRNPIYLQYCVLFKVLDNLVHNPGPSEQNLKVLNYFRSIVDNNNTESFEKGSELIDFVSVVFSKFSKDKISILHLLKDENVVSSHNISSACEFIGNSLVSLVLAFRTSNDFGTEERNQLSKTIRSELVRNEIRKTVINEWDITEPIESQYISTQVNELKEKLSDKLLNVNKQHELLLLSQNQSKLEIPNRSRDIMRRSHFDKTQCSCSVEEQQQYSPTKLIEQFLKQLKNMLFLDVTEDISSYYERFEAIIKEKGWNWNKFSYIPLLFNFFKKSQINSYEFDQIALLRIFDELFNSLPLCIHDIKMMVLLLESFKKIQFLEVFVMYLHKMQSSLAGLVFNWMFLENFTAKFDQIVSELYMKFYGFQFYFLENFSLMHLLEFESILKIEKNLAFQMYQRLRYEILANEKFYEVFLNYIDSKSLVTFILRHETYTSIVTLLKGNKQTQTEVLKRYQNKLFQSSNLLSVDSENYRFVTYDFFLMMSFIDLHKNPETTVLITQIMNFIKRKIPLAFSYHFAVVASFVGNLFFKCNYFKETVEMKILVLEALKNVETEPAEFPLYVHPVSLKQLLFGTLSFLYLGFSELKVHNQAETMFNKLMRYDYENKELNLEKDLLGVYQFYVSGDLEKAMTSLINCRVDFEYIQLKPRIFVVFQATFDRLDYLISEQMEEDKIVQSKKKKSDFSLAQLFKPL